MEIRYLDDGDDLYAVSRIYEESWKFAYRGIVPQAYLDHLPAGNWVEYLSTPGRQVLVAVESNQYIGTVSFGQGRAAEWVGYGEIISLYVLPQSIGQGYGRKLLARAMAELEQQGYRNIFLWVLAENKRARAFYEKADFSCGDNVLAIEIGGKVLQEVQYHYHF